MLNKYALLLILAVLLHILAGSYLLVLNNNLWWDSAVYIGMGKYIYSLGNSGLWEASRPLALPVFLGLLWKIGLSVFYGKILGIFFGAGCVCMAYLIGKEIFDNKTALISALFLALSPTFLLFSPKILTGIPSTFFGLVAVYFFVKRKHFFAGLFSGLAFMTRFLQLGVFIVLFFILLAGYKKEKNMLKQIFDALNGFLLVVLPYLIFNYFMYNSILYPFFLQSFLTKNTGWFWYAPWWFYFSGIFKESFVSIFSLVGIAFAFKNIRSRKIVPVLILILFFLFFTAIKHKEMRFAITFLPYLYLMSSYGLMIVIKKIKDRRIVFSVFAVIVALLVIQSGFYLYKSKKIEDSRFVIFQDYINKKEVSGGIWISSPVFAVNSDKKIDELVYYPLFNRDTKSRLEGNLQNARHILIDTCDIPCNPRDTGCPLDKINFIEKIKNSFEQVYYSKYRECEQYIFRR